MCIISLPEGFCSFLISAKRNTYAGSGDDTTVRSPFLEKSTQLEYCDGDWFYRDIYYGASNFTGFETVYLQGKPLWSMAYSGGIDLNIDVSETGRIYKFLKSALLNLPPDFPVRGPTIFSDSGYHYKMTSEGAISGFSGKEEVWKANVKGYALTFAGGFLR